jgi:hypothetical protein
MSTGGESQVITFEDGWAVIKEKITKFISNVEGGMTMDHYKIPAREYIAIYKFALCCISPSIIFSGFHVFCCP